MRDKKRELNEILNKYDSSVRKVYNEVLSEDKNKRKAQIKDKIDKEIMKQVQKDDN